MAELNVLKRIKLGDMEAVYFLDEGICSFILLPLEAGVSFCEKDVEPESLVQVKLAGDTYNAAYAMGISMRNGESSRKLKYENQEVLEDERGVTVITNLLDARGYKAKHVLQWRKNSLYVKLHSEFENHSPDKVSLELLSSFSLTGLTPYVAGDAPESMDVFRIRSVWAGEGKVERRSIEDLELERCWADHAVRSERYGQVGSMPVNHFFPFGAVYDKKNNIFWGAQVAHNASWEMEFYRKRDGLSFSGGLADREFGHWVKEIAPGESFVSPEALVSVAKFEGVYGDTAFDLFCQRLTAVGRENVFEGLECERSLPVIFNEYCTTWGNPTIENIKATIDAIRGKGFSYFVIDCGWYKQEGIPWDQGMGDYEISKLLFPNGLTEATSYINDAGMKAGLWFEVENVAPYAKAYKMEEHLLRRDDKPLTTYFRRFWDMRDPWVQKYLKDKVVGILRDNHFGYIKIDYNESIGLGCDGAESLGEGLRQNMQCSADFFRMLRKELPELVIENCASGGHRLEPLMMSLSNMASFSDAHECKEIPLIAANLHRTIHPAQSQIWAVIRETDDLKRIAYSLNATMLGRMCLSGDVTRLTCDQWRQIEDGIAFYKKVAPIILQGTSIINNRHITSMRHPKGYQWVVRYTDERALVTVHSFEELGADEVRVSLDGIIGGAITRITDVYTANKNHMKFELSSGELIIRNMEEFDSISLLVE